MRHVIWFLLAAALGLGAIGLTACDKGNGEEGGGGEGEGFGEAQEPGEVTMTALELSYDDRLAGETLRFTLNAPEGTTAEAQPGFWRVWAGGDITRAYYFMNIQRNWHADLAAKKSEIEGMNIESHEFFVDEPDVLAYELTTRDGRIERGVYVNAQAGDFRWECDAVPPNNAFFTQSQIARMVESCRSLRPVE
jgi:hypothetical protein